MKSIILELLRKFGIKLVLREIVDILRHTNKDNECRLANDIEDAMRAYDRRAGSKTVTSKF